MNSVQNHSNISKRHNLLPLDKEYSYMQSKGQKQLSEGGALSQVGYQQSYGRPSKTKQGHINISEMVSAHHKNGMMHRNQNMIVADKIYTDGASNHSNGIVSHNSNEFAFIPMVPQLDSKNNYNKICDTSINSLEHKNLLDIDQSS